MFTISNEGDLRLSEALYDLLQLVTDFIGHLNSEKARLHPVLFLDDYLDINLNVIFQILHGHLDFFGILLIDLNDSVPLVRLAVALLLL
jgi:hypothetical protein